MGLGHFGGGVGAARWLARQGASVTVTDLAGPESLQDALQALAEVPIAAFHLGGHPEDDFTKTDLLVVNPAVRPGNPFVEHSRAAGVEITSEIELFLNRCPGRVVGVTGANGKSTTAAMTAAILQASGRRCHLGGNVGRSLLDALPEMGPDDWAVLELSSFQLFHLTHQARMPELAIVTNCTPNHLNWHPDLAHYTAAKQRLVRGLPSQGFAVLNPDAPELETWSALAPGRCLPVVPADAIPRLAVLGEHNRQNARLAATACLKAGCALEMVRQGLRAFRGLPQRLEEFALVGGRRFYNDSTATTPESTIAALGTVEGPIWLLAGGADKGVDYTELASAISTHVRGAAFFGQVAPQLDALLERQGFQGLRAVVSRLDEALAWSWERSQPGDAILLSPACASLDQFRNFRERGERFGEMVQQLESALVSSTRRNA